MRGAVPSARRSYLRAPHPAPRVFHFRKPEARRLPFLEVPTDYNAMEPLPNRSETSKDIGKPCSLVRAAVLQSCLAREEVPYVYVDDLPAGPGQPPACCGPVWTGVPRHHYRNG